MAQSAVRASFHFVLILWRIPNRSTVKAVGPLVGRIENTQNGSVIDLYTPVIVPQEPELVNHGADSKDKQYADEYLDSYTHVAEQTAAFAADGYLHAAAPYHKCGNDAYCNRY